jgi:TrmH family RNA methyltransferase
MSTSNQLSACQYKTLRKLQQKKYRYQHQKYFCEGYRSFETAVSCHAPVCEVLLTRTMQLSKIGKQIVEMCKQNGYALFTLPDHKMAQISDEKTPPGILFTVALQQNNYTNLLKTAAASLLYLDRVTDPGNMGTLIRTAAWFGITTILLSPDCVDPYNPKTVRASAGAQFACNLYHNISHDIALTDLKLNRYQIIATSPAKGIPLHKWVIGKRNAVFFGQEADGLSINIIKKADVLLTIEGSQNVESLNIAVSAGIILHHLSTHRDDQ